jgi:alpha-1,6-mannosyltransferase
MVGLVLAGMEIALGGLTRPSRLVAGLALLTVAANIKIVAAVAICCVGAELARRWGRSAGRGALVMLGVLAGFVVFSLVLGVVTGLGVGWLGTLGASAGLHSWLAPTNQLGFLVGGLGTLAGVDITSAAIAVTVRIGAVVGALAGAYLLWAIFRGRRDPLTGLGLVFAVMVFAGPVVQPWYLLWAILPLAASLRSNRPLVVVSAVSAMLLPPVGGGVPVLVAGYLGAAVLLRIGFARGLADLARRVRPARLVAGEAVAGRAGADSGGPGWQPSRPAAGGEPVRRAGPRPVGGAG